jgi:hypothetical protein
VVNYIATGVYQLVLDQPGGSILNNDVGIGPSAAMGVAGTAFPTAAPVTLMISQDYLTYNVAKTAYAADSTFTSIMVQSTNGGALSDPTASYRISFELTLALSQLNS